jgi:predicted phage tail protein
MSHLTIRLLGSLGRKFGGTHGIGATRLSEGISFLRYQFEGFEQAILDLDRQGIRFSVVVQTATGNLLIDDPTGLQLAVTQDATLIIAPVPAAAGDVGKFILGVGLVAVAAFLPGTIGILGASISTSTLGLYGAGLVLGSVINWLSGTTETKSSTISPTVSNNKQGNPIPIVYGRRFVNPQVISGGTKVTDKSTNKTRTVGGFFGLFGSSQSYVDARSTASLQIVDALCEGPIKGLTNLDHSIWINGVPIRNLDNSWAYNGITGYDTRLGNPHQPAHLSPWDLVQGETTVNQKLTQAIGPVTRRINRSNATNLDAIKVRFYWDRCLNYSDSSPVKTGHTISIKEGDGSWQVRWTDTFHAYSSSSFERDVEISVNAAPYYEVRVERVIDDEDYNSKVVNIAYWKSYTTVIKSKFKYPNTATVALDIDLEKFGATDLTRIYDISGREILIPDNALVRPDGSLDYQGIWFGTFKTAWTSDPAWCLYDLLLNDRYGCGISAGKLDKFAFQAVSAYCSFLIPDGFSNFEPRFSLNAVIDTREAAFTLIQRLCGVFNAIAYYEAGNLIPVIDRPLPISHQFTNANASFSYTGTAYRNRRNRAVVSYTRADAPNSTDYEIYEDTADLLKRGVEEVQIDATQTCTSRGQAQRIGRWTIHSEQTQKESITIQTGMDGALVRPGDIIQVGDRDRAGLRRWGRIKAATINTVTLDNPVSLPAGNYTITCTLPDATLVERSIYSVVGNVVTVANNFQNIPDPQASWLIAGTDLQPTLYRVISRAEPETHRFEILGLLHEPTKYAKIENGLNLVEPPRAVNIPSPPLPPQHLVLTAYYGINISLGITWDAPSPNTYTTGYQVEYLRIGDQSVSVNANSPAYLISMAGYGEYEVKVRAIDTSGAYSGWIVANISIDATAYFATCYLNEFADAWMRSTNILTDLTNTWMSSTTSPIAQIAQSTNYRSTALIQPEPQASFGSSTHVVILN